MRRTQKKTTQTTRWDWFRYTKKPTIKGLKSGGTTGWVGGAGGRIKRARELGGRGAMQSTAARGIPEHGNCKRFWKKEKETCHKTNNAPRSFSSQMYGGIAIHPPFFLITCNYKSPNPDFQNTKSGI